MLYFQHYCITAVFVLYWGRKFKDNRRSETTDQRSVVFKNGGPEEVLHRVPLTRLPVCVACPASVARRPSLDCTGRRWFEDGVEDLVVGGVVVAVGLGAAVTGGDAGRREGRAATRLAWTHRSLVCKQWKTRLVKMLDNYTVYDLTPNITCLTEN